MRLVADETQPPQWFGWLGSPGRSEFHFDFVDSVSALREVTVRIEEQKGQRGALPHSGEAGLELLVDGTWRASWSDLGGLGEHVIPVKTASMETSRRRRLTLRLRPDANTTLRIYRVVIE
ncbi:MAG TPA: hypothetical protein VFZ65_07350 [Planctomycetota bacterium]|nr:hypothetical protein [Planctomycetota bacterium]